LTLANWLVKLTYVSLTSQFAKVNEMVKSAVQESSDAFQEAFLDRLSVRLARPTPDWPTVRCWTTASLKKLFSEVCKELAEKQIYSDSSHESLIQWLHRIGFEQDIVAEGETFHVVDLGATTKSDLDPFEFLMAVRPHGVICYFSAIAFHSLTSQPVGHHHVAELQVSKVQDRSDPEPRIAPQQPHLRATSPPRLGTQLFRFGGIPFFVTKRVTRLVPGVQLRDYGPRTQIRITTLEQTLLDALYKPFHAGGPDVVFEAWQEATNAGLQDEERMADHLTQMRFPATARRVGAMLEILGYSPGVELRRALDDAQATLDPNGPFSRISLLPGIEYRSLNENWLVWIP